MVLHLPTVASQCAPLAEQAEREHQPYLGYLEALLAAELEDRERRAIDRRIKEAHLPRIKTLDEFDFRQAPLVSPTQLSELAEGGYLERAEPIVFIGDSGTGKTHLLTALCVAACRQRRRVRFTTAAALVNELVEAKQQLQLRRALGRWARYDVIAIDEVGYVPLAELGAEFLFQVIFRSSRARGSVVDNEPAIFRVDAGHSERALVQSVARPHHGPRPHHRDWLRVVSLSTHARAAPAHTPARSR